MIDLNLLNEFGFTKRISIPFQLIEVEEEMEEVCVEVIRVSRLMSLDDNNPEKLELEEALGDLEKEILDNMLALYNLYRIVGKIGNKRDSFMEWYQKMQGYKEGKYKELVE